MLGQELSQLSADTRVKSSLESLSGPREMLLSSHILQCPLSEQLNSFCPICTTLHFSTSCCSSSHSAPKTDSLLCLPAQPNVNLLVRLYRVEIQGLNAKIWPLAS